MRQEDYETDSFMCPPFSHRGMICPEFGMLLAALPICTGKFFINERYVSYTLLSLRFITNVNCYKKSTFKKKFAVHGLAVTEASAKASFTRSFV